MRDLVMCRKNSVVGHSQSNEHIKAELLCMKQTSHTPVCEADETESYEPKVKYIKLFSTIFCLAKKLQPSDMTNTLLKLQSLNGVDLEYQNLSWNTIKAIQNCISDTIQRFIIKEVLESQFYGILIDESTDITVQKHLSVCIRYVCKGAPVTKFLTNACLDDGKAHTVANVTVKCLEEFGLKLSNMVSLATNRASVMTGRKTGV